MRPASRGRPPGNSQGTSSGCPMVAWPRRVARCSRMSPARGSGSTIGTLARVSLMVVPSSSTAAVVRLSMPAGFWAESSTSSPVIRSGSGRVWSWRRPAGVLPPSFGVVRPLLLVAGVAVVRFEARPGVLAGHGPPDKGAGAVPVGELAVCGPGVKVGLGDAREGQPVARGQVQQADRRQHVVPDACRFPVGRVPPGRLVLSAGAFAPGEPSAQPPQEIPPGVLMQDLSFPRVAASCDDVGEPALQAGHALIERRQAAGGRQSRSGR